MQLLSMCQITVKLSSCFVITFPPSITPGDPSHVDGEISPRSVRKFHRGPYIKDVRTKGGGGVSPKADIVREVAWIYSYRSSQNADKGGEGVQNPENFADVLYVWSLKA